MNKVHVIGAGAWGTALALQAVRAGAQVRLWARDPARAEAIARTRQNPHLPGVTLPEALHISHRWEQADLLLLATPTPARRARAPELPPGRRSACGRSLRRL